MFGSGEFKLVLGAACFGVSANIKRIALEGELGVVELCAARNLVQFCIMFVFLPYLRRLTPKKEALDAAVLSVRVKNELKWMASLRKAFNISVENNYNFQLAVWSILIGLFCGTTNVCFAMSLVNLATTKAVFLSSLYVVIAPLIECGLLRMNTPMTIYNFVSIVLMVIGFYFLSGCQASCVDIGLYEFVAVFGSFTWSLGMICSNQAAQINSVELTTYTTLVSGVYHLFFVYIRSYSTGIPTAFNFRGEDYTSVGLIAVADNIAFVLNNLGLSTVPASSGSLLMALEAPFASLFSFVIMGEVLPLLEYFGCALVLLACVVVTFGNQK